MATDITEIAAQIRSLSREEKAGLVRALISDLDGPADAEVERDWLAEAQRRHREVVDVKVEPVSGKLPKQ